MNTTSTTPGLQLVPATQRGSRWLPPMEGIDQLWRAGPIALPGSGRVVWWTGRVAIGLRYDGPHRPSAQRDGVRWINT